MSLFSSLVSLRTQTDFWMRLCSLVNPFLDNALLISIGEIVTGVSDVVKKNSVMTSATKLPLCLKYFVLNSVGDRRRSRRHNSVSQIDVSSITKDNLLAPPGAKNREGSMHKVASAPNVGTAVKVEPPASPVKTSASTTPSSSTESELDEKTRNRLARKYVLHNKYMLDVVINSLKLGNDTFVIATPRN